MSFRQDEPDYEMGHQLQEMPSTPVVSTNVMDNRKSELSPNVTYSTMSFLQQATTILINICLVFNSHHASEMGSPNMKPIATMLLLQCTASLKAMRRIRLEHILKKANGKATVSSSNMVLVLPVDSP